MLKDISKKIKYCKSHLNKTGTNGSELESILTQYLLIYICSEYEKEIKNIIINRIRKINDPEVESFIEQTVDIRDLNTGQIGGKILKRFSQNWYDSFSKKTKDKSWTQLYSNIITNRNLAAHGKQLNMSFKELINSHESAEKVLKAMEDSINGI